MEHSTHDQVRLGFIGAGNIGKVHMNAFRLLEGVELVAVTDAVRSVAETAKDQFGVLRVYDTPKQLLEDKSIDALVIGVPNHLHASLAVAALQAKKHVLLEKPMALDAEEAKAIVRAERDSGKRLMIAHQMRWSTEAIAVKEQVNCGGLGNVYAAKAGWFRRKGIPGWGTWFTRKAEAGGGPLIDIGVHMLDLALFLMGNPNPVSVVGSTYAKFGPERRGIGDWGKPDWDGYFDVEDFALALIKMENGSTLTLEVSWAVHMDTDSQPFVHILGDKGGASLRGDSGKLLTEIYAYPVDVPLTRPSGDIGDRVRLSQHFIECVRGNQEPISSSLAGLTTQLILDAIYESSRTGRQIELDWSI
ncbi:Gfo/Idh/MocA family protein [Alicyclobacillus sp. SP_1]|uniref:Gfo/Idh/MocA family protein n=1 Tax=Alicyclobacillus sp. SP_1 TaxID=2942475 RepID=UPI00215771A7|nr:Gfo/Idh/MocA family oxidoreductase [Alicyclobacillus sp. SP_1]